MLFDLQTADENWNPSLLDESSRLFFKVRSSAIVAGEWPVFPSLSGHLELLHSQSSNLSLLLSGQWLRCLTLCAICSFRIFIKAKTHLLSGIDQITLCPPASGQASFFWSVRQFRFDCAGL